MKPEIVLLHHHPAMSLEVVVKKIRQILLEDFLILLLGLGDPGLRWMFSEPDLIRNRGLFLVRLSCRTDAVATGLWQK